MALLETENIIGISLFQLIRAQGGTVNGAATQVVGVLGAIAYVPGMGIASASTGQRNWLQRDSSASARPKWAAPSR